MQKLNWKMKKIKKYNSIESAIENILTKNNKYRIIKHSFSKGHIVKPHYHPNANEWLIFDSGKFELQLGAKKELIVTSKPTVIFIEKGEVHGLKCITKMNYFVIRDGEEKIIRV